MSRMEIEQLLKPDIRKQTFALKFFVWIYIVILAFTAILFGANIVRYQTNSSMVALEAVLALVSASFTIYGIHLYISLRHADRLDKSILDTVKENLVLLRTKFNVWYVIIGCSIVLLTFAVNTWVDYKDGVFTIGRPGLFIAFTLFQFMFVYLINRLAHYPYIRQLKAAVYDLENQVHEKSGQVMVMKKKLGKWMTVSVILGVLLLLWGLWRYLQG